MPIYRYKCKNCGKTIEELISANEIGKEMQCPDCNAFMIKIFGTVGVKYNSGGFYSTDANKDKEASKKGCC
jgi:putative FmdB family regulatory protein